MIDAVRTKHVVTDASQLHPGIIAAGATTAFAADLAVVAFTPALAKRPLLTNIAQGFVLFFAGDSYFQILEQGWKKSIGYKLLRAMRNGVIGALNSGFLHYNYYVFVDKHFPYHKFSEKVWGPPDKAKYKLGVAAAKYWLEWPTIGAYKIASSFILTALMGGDRKGLAEKFKKRFWLTMLRGLQVWPVYDCILYAYVPTSHRPLFNTFMSIAWGGYLSHISQEEHPVSAQQEDVVQVEEEIEEIVVDEDEDSGDEEGEAAPQEVEDNENEDKDEDEDEDEE
ncbi:unnamed protein product [Chrysoparadoxa australica]